MTYVGRDGRKPEGTALCDATPPRDCVARGCRWALHRELDPRKIWDRLVKRAEELERGGPPAVGGPGRIKARQLPTDPSHSSSQTQWGSQRAGPLTLLLERKGRFWTFLERE